MATAAGPAVPTAPTPSAAAPAAPLAPTQDAQATPTAQTPVPPPASVAKPGDAPAAAPPATPPARPVEVAQQPPAAVQRARPREQGIVAEPSRWRVLEPGGIAVKPRNPLYDPYEPNMLKGDYPAFGDKTFYAVNATLDAIADFKRNLDFFQSGKVRNVPFHEHNTVTQLTGVLAMELFHGDTVFAPKDWAVRLTPIVRWRCGDKNAIDQGCGEDIRMLEAFGEAKLFEVGETFDATSARVGLQFFNSDFFGFVYNDVQPGVRIFGELDRNQFKFNLAGFDRLNKEKLSGLNEFKRREHQVAIASFQWDDFVFPGFNILPSFHYSHDDILDGTLDAYYVGFTTNGRLGRFNVNSALYYVFGNTARNTPSRRTEEISAGMAFAQLAYPTRYYAPRLAVAYATGDGNPDDRRANGFDSIFDNVAFGGGQFSYLFGEKIQRAATTLLRGNSIFPSLRGANATAQFVNPGIIAFYPGIDVALTPKTIFEANYDVAWFDRTSSLERLVGRRRVSTLIGHEANAGVTYRPFLNEQVILFAGGAVFFPGQGITDTFGTEKAVYKALVRVILSF
jgi:hypothetical protein